MEIFKRLGINLTRMETIKLDAKAKDKFKAKKTGAVLEFSLPNQQIFLTRSGGT